MRQFEKELIYMNWKCMRFYKKKNEIIVYAVWCGVGRSRCPPWGSMMRSKLNTCRWWQLCNVAAGNSRERRRKCSSRESSRIRRREWKGELKEVEEENEASRYTDRKTDRKTTSQLVSQSDEKSDIIYILLCNL